MSLDRPFIEKLQEKAKSIPQLREIVERMRKNPNGAIDQVEKEILERIQEYQRDGKTAKLRNTPKYSRLLTHVKSFSDIRPGDVLSMKKQGENIGNYLMTDSEGNEVNLSNDSLSSYIGKELKINFGINRFLNARIGLGDLLPHEVTKVEVTDNNGNKKIGTLGYQDSRKGRRERLGYYDENGEYMPVYSNFSVRFLEIGSISNKERDRYAQIEENYYKNVRMEEMVSIYTVRNGLQKTSKEKVQATLSDRFPTPEDALLFEEVSNKINIRVQKVHHVQEAFHDGIGNREKFIGKFGWYLRDVIGKDFSKIPAYTLVNLIGQESKFNPNALNRSTGAYGLGQITPSTWSFIEERINKDLDRENPYDQLYATAYYINWIMGYKKCDVTDGIVYYHMGPNVDVYMKNGDLEKLAEYKSANPAIERSMRDNTWTGYWDAARRYYTDSQGLLTNLDLSKSSTELASKLGDFVMGASLPNTGSASCGAAVGSFLNRFGIEGLPQGGRDGNKWDSILAPRVANGQFKKVAIGHPDEAQPGGIITFDGSGELGSEKNKSFGHVEIKGSDGNYYSYYEGSRPGGSAATNTKNPEEYRKLTGFTGYVYYPVTRSV